MDAETRSKSEWNQAASFLDRLDDLFSIAHVVSIQQNAYLWYSALNRIRMELFDDMVDKDQAAIKALSDDIRKIVFTKKDVKITPSLYDKLEFFEEYLRRIYSSAGYKTRTMDDPRFVR